MDQPSRSGRVMTRPPVHQKRVRISARAGCLGTRPDSVMSLETALSYPVDSVEADVRFDPSGRAYLSHEPLSPKEQKKAMTLETLFEMAIGHPTVKLHLHLKEFSGLKQIEKLAKDTDLISRVFLTSVPLKYLKAVRREVPELAVYVSAIPTLGQRYLFGACDQWVRQIREGDAVGLITHYRFVTRLMRQVLWESNLQLWVGTVDRERDMRRLLALPVDGIITRRIDRLIDLRSRLAPPRLPATYRNQQ